MRCCTDMAVGISIYQGAHVMYAVEEKYELVKWYVNNQGPFPSG